LDALQAKTMDGVEPQAAEDRVERPRPSREVRQRLGRAINGYRLIEAGDRIAVAVSGGKDSLVLLWLLRERLRRIPIDYDLVALHVDLGFDPEPAMQLEAFFKAEGFPYRVIKTRHGIRAHSDDNLENPCFLCSRLRRASLFQAAHELGCAKIAFGHNQDDFIETFLINVFYGGQVSGMLPRQPFFAGKITVIRPLALFPAERVDRLRQQLDLPVVLNPCPTKDVNKRMEIRALLHRLYDENEKVRGNIFHAMSNLNPDYLPPALDGRRSRKAPPARLRTGAPRSFADS
jgi:tRNA 2-thiocytidine biosynthesis protein TtcA